MFLFSWHTLTTLNFPTNLIGRLAMPVTILMVLSVANTLAYLTWNLWPQPVSTPPPRISTIAKSTVARGLDTDAITSSNLFGKADVTRPSPTVATPRSVPVTSLKLTLRGIIAAIPPDGGAIIAETSGPDRFFRVGDSIAGGAVLQEIQTDQVILMRNQRLETLRLPKNKELKGRKFNNPIMPNVEPNVVEPDVTPENTEATEAEPEAEPEPEVESEEPGPTLNEYRQQLFENPANLMHLVQTQPVYQSGQLQGFRLRPGQKGGNLLQRYGLKSNDLVTSLNGIPLDNPMKAFEVLRDLRNAATLNVGVSRLGRTENITLHFTK